MAERGAASRAPCLASTALGRSGTRAGGTTTLTRSVRYRDDSHAQRQCWKRAVSGSATPEPENRRAERRRAQRSLSPRGRARRKVCNGILEAPLGAPPLGLRGEKDTTATVAPTEAAADFAWLFENLAV